MIRVLFVSTGNAARSPIAEVILAWLSSGRAAVISAGVAPKAEIHPMAREAVKNVFNSRMAQQRPRDVRALVAEHFDYVFTLSHEALAQTLPPATHPSRVHWPVEDPALVHGTRDQRQRAFDRVTRDLLKQLRAWWPPESAAETRTSSRLPRRKASERAQWRTRPDGTSPVVAVAYFGSPRRCKNLCGLLERSGYRVIFSDMYGRVPASPSVLPDAVIVRVDGAHRPNEPPRTEFKAVATLRAALGPVPIMLLADRTPSPGEQRVLESCNAVYWRRRPSGGAAIVKALEDMVNSRSRS